MRIADDSFVFSDFSSSLPTDAVAVKDIPVRTIISLSIRAQYHI